MKKNSIKNIRINSEVHRALSEIIRFEVKDPRLNELISVTDVETAPDLKSCKVFISVLGDEEIKKEVFQALKSASGFIRTRLAKEINLRNTPALSFHEDNSMEYGAHMNELFNELHKKEENGNIE